MSEYLLGHGTQNVTQSEKLREDQVENSAGGFVWQVDKWTRLRRFLVLGSEGGSYYASERDLTKENVGCVRECVREDGPRTVAEIVAVSEGGVAPKNDPALFALAVCISEGDKATKKAAAEALPRVARIGTHLFHFASYAQSLRGWGRTLRWAVRNWYESKGVDDLAYQVVKYRQRDGWSHRDLLRLAHPDPEGDGARAALYDWTVGRTDMLEIVGEPVLPGIVEGFERAQRAATAVETATLVREYRLPREALQTDHLSDQEVWKAMLEQGMPMTALIRNLATMTRNGVLGDAEYRKVVLDQIGEADAIRKARVHPLAILVAQRTYAAGHGFRGGNTWTPIPDITDALDEAFYMAFDNVEPTGKSHLLALDISSSMMHGSVAGSPLTPAEAACAMALVTLHAEANVEVVGFHTHLIPLGISRRQRLDDAVAEAYSHGFGGTDCSLPMRYALGAEGTKMLGTYQGNRYGGYGRRAPQGVPMDGAVKNFDAFCVYTDSETWEGDIHPKVALDRYRQVSGIQARSVVVAMVANPFSIADPNDPGMLDCVGMDTSTPQVIANFVAGRV